MESGYTYPERSDNKLAAGEARPKAATTDKEGNSISDWYCQKSAEVVVGEKRGADIRHKSHRQTEGPNVRIGERTTQVYHVGANQPNHVRELLT
jgi:hypothetical protein